MAFADLEAFEARHGDVPDDQEEIVETLLGDASALILSEVGGSDQAWVVDAESDNPPDAPAAVVAVTIAAAYRAWRNPDALAASGLGAASSEYGGRRDADALFLTERECKVVRRAAKRSSFRTSTLVSPYSGDDDEIDLDFDLGS